MALTDLSFFFTAVAASDGFSVQFYEPIQMGSGAIDPSMKLMSRIGDVLDKPSEGEEWKRDDSEAERKKAFAEVFTDEMMRAARPWVLVFRRYHLTDVSEVEEYLKRALAGRAMVARLLLDGTPPGGLEHGMIL